MKRTRIASFAAAVALFGGAVPATADVVLNPASYQSEGYAVKRNGTGYSSSVLSVGGPLRFQATANAPDGGAADYSTAIYDLTASQFHVTMDQMRVSTTAGRSVHSVMAEAYGSLFFTPDADTGYGLSAEYHVDQKTSAGAEDYFYLSLTDVTLHQTLFSSEQQSHHTLSPDFVTGQDNGDASNTTVGSLTGTLLTGHLYQLDHDFYAEGHSRGDGGATAFGSVTLDFTSATSLADPAEAPLPSTAWAGVVLLGGLAFGRFFPRRRRA
jgi:hypothetical protein